MDRKMAEGTYKDGGSRRIDYCLAPERTEKRKKQIG